LLTVPYFRYTGILYQSASGLLSSMASIHAKEA
jgi:hypothetical protein